MQVGGTRPSRADRQSEIVALASKAPASPGGSCAAERGLRRTSILARFPALSTRGARAACLAAVAACLAAPAARADTVAAVEVPAADGTNLDLALVNAGIGLRTALPAGINTAADELHPSLSSDGRRLTFERVDRAGGTTRIIAADLATGQQADLFNSFEAQSDPPTTPSITPDGSVVITGRRLEHLDSSSPAESRQPSWTHTSLSAFPAGPFARARVTGHSSVTANGRTMNPLQTASGLFASEIRDDVDGNDALYLLGSGEAVVSEKPSSLRHPALGGSSSAPVVVFERKARLVFGGPFVVATALAFLPASSEQLQQIPAPRSVNLPAIVNAPGLDESRPAFTGAGRFLAFVRHGSDGHDRLFLFDLQTQTLLNASGIDLGALNPAAGAGLLARTDGNVAPRQVPLFFRTHLTFDGNLLTHLLSSTGVGILVQRIVGHHRLLGRRVPKLRLVGRVPFGSHRAGRFRTHWNLKVNGKRLKPGNYLVTVRAVTRKGKVRELGRSFRFHVRKKRRH